MQNYIDDNEAYAKLKPACDCGDIAHCGHSCSEEDCDCFECRCPACLQQQ